MNMPNVSIGFPVYNGGNYIKEAINSILSQTYTDFEMIISDNGSTDNTMEICNSYAIKDLRIRYYRNNINKGGAWNFNNVFRFAIGKYFIWACHDDVWNSNLLERYVNAFSEMPDIISCYSRTTFINEHGEPLFSVVGRPDLNIASPHQRFRLFLKYHSPTNECSQVLGLFRIDVLRKTPLIGKYPSSDMILLGEIALRGKSHEVKNCLLIRRDHPLKSTTAYPTIEERIEWFDPLKKGKIQFTTWQWVYELHKSVFRSPVDLFEKAICMKEVWKWGWTNRIDMKKEIRKCAKRVLRPNG